MGLAGFPPSREWRRLECFVARANAVIQSGQKKFTNQSTLLLPASPRHSREGGNPAKQTQSTNPLHKKILHLAEIIVIAHHMSLWNIKNDSFYKLGSGHAWVWMSVSIKSINYCMIDVASPSKSYCKSWRSRLPPSNAIFPICAIDCTPPSSELRLNVVPVLLRVLSYI